MPMLRPLRPRWPANRAGSGRGRPQHRHHLRAGCSCRRRPVPAHHGLRAAWVSGWPRAAQRPTGEREGRAAAGTPDGQERPPAPGAAELAGLPCRSRTGAEFPGPFRSDGLGNHRVHDILLARGPPFRALLLTLSLRGTTVPRRRTHRPSRHGLEDGTRCLMHPEPAFGVSGLEELEPQLPQGADLGGPECSAAVARGGCVRRTGVLPEGARHRAVSDQDGQAFPRSVRGCHDAG